jgi:hypothetical protein
MSHHLTGKGNENDWREKALSGGMDSESQPSFISQTLTSLCNWFVIFRWLVSSRSFPTLPDTVPPAFRGPFSYILCSEILYLPQFHRALLKTITQFSNDETVVILLWKQRGLGEERFFEIASRPSTGWDVHFVSVQAFVPELCCITSTHQVTFGATFFTRSWTRVFLTSSFKTNPTGSHK